MPNFSYLRENNFCHSQKMNSSSPFFIHVAGRRDSCCLQMGCLGWEGRSSWPHIISSVAHCFNEWTSSCQLWLSWSFPKALPELMQHLTKQEQQPVPWHPMAPWRLLLPLSLRCKTWVPLLFVTYGWRAIEEKQAPPPFMYHREQMPHTERGSKSSS